METELNLSMPFWYFFTVPKLPSHVSHQSEQVELMEYLCDEGDTVQPGTPLAVIENYWAVIQLKAAGGGIVRRTFFPAHTQVKIGDPIAIIATDGEKIPYGGDYSLVEIVEEKHRKPGH